MITAVAQLSQADLKRMAAANDWAGIQKARKEGRFNTLIGIEAPTVIEGPWSAEDLHRAFEENRHEDIIAARDNHQLDQLLGVSEPTE